MIQCLLSLHSFVGDALEDCYLPFSQNYKVPKDLFLSINGNFNYDLLTNFKTVFVVLSFDFVF